MSSIEVTVADLLKKYSLPKDSAWLHGQSKKWIMKHSALEYIAAQENIIFDMPTIVQIDLTLKVACIIVKGHIKNEKTLLNTSNNETVNLPPVYRSEWSFGEATADNCKMGYYAAMAEKRAKDRVILKLLNLQGDVYSDVEADEFKAPKEDKAQSTAADNKREILAAQMQLDDVKDLTELQEAWTAIYPLYKRLSEDKNNMTKDASHQTANNLLKRKEDLKKLFKEMEDAGN